jgi:DNA invertase Pin-like site-specific DNA recombinase
VHDTTEARMIAALYARRSTEQNVSEDAKSVTRQITLARAFAEAHGWIVAEEHVYSDDGISGAEFDDRRPGLARLLAALKQRPRPFDVLVMMDESTLSAGDGSPARHSGSKSRLRGSRRPSPRAARWRLWWTR